MKGTIPIDYGEADLVLISVDGSKETHKRIRGNTYDIILNNIRHSESDKIIIYMAINKWKQHEIGEVCEVVKAEHNIRAVSFNFTPFSWNRRIDPKQKRKN